MGCNMNIRIYNAQILTMKPGQEIFSGEVQIKEGKISYIGPATDKQEKIWDREIDGNHNLIMPGFKNAHTHSAMTFLRSYADDLPLEKWLYDRVFPMEAKLTAQDIYWCAMLANLEYLTSGITANFDMYTNNEATAKASEDMGFRTVLCGSINNYVGSIPQMEEDYQRFNQGNPLLSFQLGFHGEYTTDRKILEQVAQLSQKYHAPVYFHNSETKKEVAGCIERYGKTPTQFCDALGMFEYGGGGFHCVHMTQEDLDICKEKKVWVVTNPGSNVKLASGIAPIEKMLHMGIGLAIGTDGPASNNCLDMFREMFLVTGLQKILREDPAVTDAMEVLKMATVGGAGAMGLKQCDVLDVGKWADMIMIDLHQPNMQPFNHIAKNIVYSGSKQNVKMTMIAGKILYEDGQFCVNMDIEEIYRKANACIERIKNS